MKSNKYISGKATVLSLTAVVLVASFLLGKSLTSVSAQCGGPGDGWTNVGGCVANSCGTREGKQQQSKTTTTRECETGCPSVTFTTGRCDPSYHYWDGKCYKMYSSPRDPLETFSVTFTYDKPVGDEHHCHKPTPESLNVPSWARGEYGSLTNELDVRHDINCHDVTNTETRTIDCHNAPYVPCTCPDRDGDSVCDSQDNCI